MLCPIERCFAPHPISLFSEKRQQLEEHWNGLLRSSKRCADLLHDIDWAERMVELPSVCCEGKTQLFAGVGLPAAKLVYVHHELATKLLAHRYIELFDKVTANCLGLETIGCKEVRFLRQAICA